MSAETYPLQTELTEAPRSWRRWGVILALVLAWHVLLFLANLHWFPAPPPARVELQQIDHEELLYIYK